eukprot:6205965-Pleurochrysis_carterae.AAC.2
MAIGKGRGDLNLSATWQVRGGDASSTLAKGGAVLCERRGTDMPKADQVNATHEQEEMSSVKGIPVV